MRARALLRLPGGRPVVPGHARRQLPGRDLCGGVGVPGMGHALVRPTEPDRALSGQHHARRHALRPPSSAGGGQTWWA